MIFDDDAMAHPMEPEYVMIESVRDAQPDVEDGTTISSPGMESLDAAADAASTALRHAEAEGARGLAVFGQPVLVSELDAQAKIRELERHLEALKLQIAEREDADMGVDLLGLESQADDGACPPPSAPGAPGPAAEGVAPAAVVAPSTSPTTRSAAAAQPSMLTAMAEPPLAWPVAAEPRPAASDNQMEEDTTERPGLGLTPPVSDPVDAMAAAALPLTPLARAQAPEPPRPTKRPAPHSMEEPTSKTPTLPGFTRASSATLGAIAMPIRFLPVTEPENHVRFAMLPDSFPPIPGHLAGLLTSCSEKEMVQLFDQLTGYPLSTPVVTRIIEQYLPLRAMAMQEKIWTQRYQKATDKSGLTDQKGLHLPAGDMPFHSMCGKCLTPWPDNATRCWTCKHDQAIEYQRPTSIMEVGTETWTLLYEAGRPVWRRAAPVQSTPGALGPEATSVDPDAERHFKLSHSIDGSQFAQAPAATCTEEERTFADEVPSVCRVHIRQEILSADYEDDAAETTEAHRRRLTEQQPSQSFQIFHPEAAKALRIQSEALQGLASADLKAERAQAEEAERQENADQVSQLQAAVLAPIPPRACSRSLTARCGTLAPTSCGRSTSWTSKRR